MCAGPVANSPNAPATVERFQPSVLSAWPVVNDLLTLPLSERPAVSRPRALPASMPPPASMRPRCSQGYGSNCGRSGRAELAVPWRPIAHGSKRPGSESVQMRSTQKTHRRAQLGDPTTPVHTAPAGERPPAPPAPTGRLQHGPDLVRPAPAPAPARWCRP